VPGDVPGVGDACTHIMVTKKLRISNAATPALVMRRPTLTLPPDVVSVRVRESRT
jgi:hypothetical protein